MNLFAMDQGALLECFFIYIALTTKSLANNKL